MKKKIFISSFLVGMAVMLLCCVMFVRTIYRNHERQVFAELEAEAEYVAHAVELSGSTYFDTLETQERITWVAADGTVLYDSAADADTMPNHLSREEIRQAVETGTGTSVRNSDTMLARTLYYARQAADGTVVRVSCRQDTVFALMLNMLGPMLWIILLALGLALLISYSLARSITGPINAIQLDDPVPEQTYPELRPLVERLRRQKRTIGQQMAQLRQRQQEFAAITDNMSEGFLLVDNKTNILSGNHSARRILGVEQELTNLRQQCDNPQINAVVETALTGARAEEVLVIDERSWEVIANPVVSSGQVVGAVVLVMDVTEREQREQLRREFSANVSHELQTPLTSISGFAELMQTGMVPPEKVQEFAGDIYRESRRLIVLVEDIIQLSRLDESIQIPEREPVDLYELADEILGNLQTVAAKQQVSLHLEGEHAVIRGVWQILNEMLYNLCDNAIKYNKPGGSVTVHIRRTADQVRLCVADTGIGIPYAHQSRVFERFYRVDKSHSKEIGGTGLGLSIVKHGAQYHDARLELTSQPDQGTTITIVFQGGV